MKRDHVLISLFFLISAIFFYLFYRIIVPFFVPIAWAAVFVILFHPLYNRLVPKVRRKGVASALLCGLIFLLILGPVGYLGVALVNEAAQAVTRINELYKSGELSRMFTFDAPWIRSVLDWVSQYYDLSQIDIGEIAKDAANAISSIVVAQTSNLITNGAQMLFYFLLMFFTMYYFFMDGGRVIDRIRRLLPLSEEQIDLTFKQLRDIIHATMYGGLVVAGLQGLIGGIVFWAVGIPSAIFWGSIMAFLSIIPIVGAFIVYIPAGIILIIMGHWVKGLIVILLGTLVLSQVDNVLRPLLISGKAAIHPLLLFFSIMGGIALFGLLGIIIGPIIAAVFVTLLRVFETRLHEDQAAGD
jgi:predicted PurR-regulated permease PerM